MPTGQQFGEPSADQGGPGEIGARSPQPPQISLPTGGGAIRSIDEKFQVNPARGTGSLRISVASSGSRQDFGPDLSISYDSGAGNGPFGVGWDLSLPKITRKTGKGLPTYDDADDADTFVLSGIEDLVPEIGNQGGTPVRHSEERLLEGRRFWVERYRPRIEGLFARIERWTNQETGETHWRSINRDNVTSLYGRTGESRVMDRNDPLRTFSWLICESFDDKGNAIFYRYVAEDQENVNLSQAHERNRAAADRSANRYPKRILYGNRTPRQPGTDLAERSDWMFQIVFDYGEAHIVAQAPDIEGRQIVQANTEPQQTWPVRQDPFSRFLSGSELRTYRLCRRVLMFHHFPEELGAADYLVRATEFGYVESPVLTRMTSVAQSAFQRQDDGLFERQSHPSIEFEFSQAEIQTEIRSLDADSLGEIPAGLADPRFQLVDLDGEGIAGILGDLDGAWYYKANLGDGRFAPQDRVESLPAPVAGARNHQLLDLAGDGQLDLVSLKGDTPGFYERRADKSWEPHRTFESMPVLEWDSRNQRFIDLTGDGLADILVTEDSVFTWYASKAEKGFAESRHVVLPHDEETGPRLVFADTEETIYLADMSGDGLTDLVRIRNGEVCYWPNLGYGKFGAKVAMDNAPVFERPGQFDQKRIRLGDVDGSGITDILYFGSQSVSVFLNEAGNSWSAASVIEMLPRMDRLSEVSITDLFGNGTACIVWSSPHPTDSGRQIRYLDLMGGVKPHLMTGIRNNRGAETLLHYASSTRFYLEDKAAGHPWITRLPFPVHVVERVEALDLVSGSRFVSRYSYHHGHFDGHEREFCGFGMVEQIDTEEFGVLAQEGNLPAAANLDEATHVPPVVTRTWYHPGIYLGRDRVSNFFAGLIDTSSAAEYYREPGLSDDAARALLLDDTILPDGLSTEEEREACRALKGLMLRQEIYARDGTEAAAHPYVVTEQNHTVRIVQRRGPNRHAVFFRHPREALSYHYERNPADPRTTHSLTLEIDDFGNPLLLASIAYGRRQAEPNLDPSDQAHQAALHFTASEYAYSNAVSESDQYRTPLISEARRFELSGINLAQGRQRFGFSEVANAIHAAGRIAYHEEPEGGLELRLLEQHRTLYRPDDLGTISGDPNTLLPLGVIEPRALPGESYQLALMAGHLEQVFEERVSAQELSDDGGYVHFNNDADWWIPSGRVFFSPNRNASAAEELQRAEEDFFLPRRFQDAHGHDNLVDYDDSGLFPTQTTDPAGNSVLAEHDYRLLVPRLTTDPNGNRSAVAFDVHGSVVGKALMGASSESVGDTLEDFSANLNQAQMDAFLADPTGPIAAELLGSATSRFIHDPSRFERLGEPVFTATILRESHRSDLVAGAQSNLQVNLVYSDGQGQPIQSKAQAEPGPVEDGGSITAPRWVTSGWRVLNNKGQTVRSFEPFFTSTHEFTFGTAVGVSSTVFYDPTGRVIATLLPDHSWQKVRFDPWQQEAWDVNDTVLVEDPTQDPVAGGHFARLPDEDYRPTWHQARASGALGVDAQSAAEKAAAHADTPAVFHFDSLGRPFLAVADNGAAGTVRSRTSFDIDGRPQRLIDDRGNSVMTYQVVLAGAGSVPGYDMVGRQLYENSMDSGERWVLPDIDGQPFRSFDSRGNRFRTFYDSLRRSTHLFIRGNDSEEILVERTIYGESHPDAAALNLRGRAFQVYDGAGVVTTSPYDFKGNLLEGRRRLAHEYRSTMDWSDLTDQSDLAAIESAAEPFLEDRQFTSRTTYDALDRPIAIETPDSSVVIPEYNAASLLERFSVQIRGADQPTRFIENVDYNAKGQRELVTYATADGAHLTTLYSYDPHRFRLIRMRTERHRDDRVLQDLAHTYDPIGNIASTEDTSQQTIFFANQPVEPHSDYTYDALYRLIRAEGREHAAENSIQRGATDIQSLIGIPHPNSPQALQRYVQEYEYDGVGNILRMRHIGGGVPRWTRRYQYAEESNHLIATSELGDGPEEFSATYTYDAHGNMTSMPHLPMMRWDSRDQLTASSRQSVSDGNLPETTYYVYDGAGVRVRKVTERASTEGAAATRRSERIYLAGLEIYREFAGDGTTVTLERETLHVTDDETKIAQIDTRTMGDDGVPGQSRRFQLSNHSASVMLEVDQFANVITKEEYHPYGTSSLRLGDSSAEVSLKRFRFTGKERDHETGFHYHGARYYAGWLARWTATDPLGLADGVNLYRYVNCNPISYSDPSGTTGRPTDEELGDYARQADAHNTAVQTWHAEVATFDPKAKNAKHTARRLENERVQLLEDEAALWSRWLDLAERQISADYREWRQQLEKELEEGGQEFMNLGRRTMTRTAGATKFFLGLALVLIPSGVTQVIGADFLQAGGIQGVSGEESNTLMRGGAALMSEGVFGNSAPVAAVHGDMAEYLIPAVAGGVSLGVGIARSSLPTLLPAQRFGSNFTPPVRRFAYYSDVETIPPTHAASTPRQSARRVMGQSAEDVTNIPRSQWLHMLARRFGGGETPGNLVAGTFEANYQMGRVESLVNHLEGLGQRVEYSGVLRGQTLRLRLISNDKLVLNLRLDVRTTVVAPRGSSNIFNQGWSSR